MLKLKDKTDIEQELIGGTLLLMGSSAFRAEQLPVEIAMIIDEAMEREMEIIVGEAHGASRCFQDFLKYKGYQNVTLGHAKSIRYNAGKWKTIQYGDSLQEKEHRMIEECDSAVIIWTNHSSVITQDILYLRKLRKPTFIYECWTNDRRTPRSGWLGSGIFSGTLACRAD